MLLLCRLRTQAIFSRLNEGEAQTTRGQNHSSGVGSLPSAAFGEMTRASWLCLFARRVSLGRLAARHPTMGSGRNDRLDLPRRRSVCRVGQTGSKGNWLRKKPTPNHPAVGSPATRAGLPGTIRPYQRPTDFSDEAKKKARVCASAPNLFPATAVCTLRSAIEDLIDRVAVSDPLQEPNSVKEVSLATSVCPDKDIQRSKIERHLSQTLEPADLDVLDHCSLRHTSSPLTTVATGPPRKVLPSNGELRLRDGDWFTS